MRNLHLRVRSTKNKPPLALSPTPPAIPTLPTKDVFVTVYNPRETIFTYQTSKFILHSSRCNQYQMIVHDIDSSSSWIEPMKNKTEVEIIFARRRSLARMKLQGIVPKHPRETIFTYQTGKFPLRSSSGNQCQVIVHDINSGSSWIEPMKNKTEGEMILARRRALARMKL